MGQGELPTSIDGKPEAESNGRPILVSGGCGSQGNPSLVGGVLFPAHQGESPKLCCRQRTNKHCSRGC